jgi:hypothetical protein
LQVTFVFSQMLISRSRNSRVRNSPDEANQLNGNHLFCYGGLAFRSAGVSPVFLRWVEGAPNRRRDDGATKSRSVRGKLW